MTANPVYYNEWDGFCADWLQNLMAAGLIPAGDVDRRSIRDVQPADLKGYRQCHFFAGIAGWSIALNLAGWPDDRDVWTGSCPCQRLSSAARGRNTAEDMWPEWWRLISAKAPRTVFGEQVANKTEWFERCSFDLERLGYKVGAAVLPAFSVGQNHARYRLYFVGDTNGHSKPSRGVDAETSGVPGHSCEPRRMGKKNGVSARVGQLRAYGNAIVPQVAAEFIAAYLDCRP